MTTDSTIYVVLARCNFDDVIVGAYTKLVHAKRRANQVDLSPELRFKTKCMANDTGYIRTCVYAVCGAKVIGEVYEAKRGPEAAGKAQT